MLRKGSKWLVIILNINLIVLITNPIVFLFAESKTVFESNPEQKQGPDLFIILDTLQFINIIDGCELKNENVLIRCHVL